MCLPALPVIAISAAQASAATLAVAAASAGLTYYGQMQSVRAAQAATDANAAAAASSAASQYRGVIVQQLQEEDAAAQEIDRVEREALKAESSAALAGIESGAGGSDAKLPRRGAVVSDGGEAKPWLLAREHGDDAGRDWPGGSEPGQHLPPGLPASVAVAVRTLDGWRVPGRLAVHGPESERCVSGH